MTTPDPQRSHTPDDFAERFAALVAEAKAEANARIRAAADVDDETARSIGLDPERYPRPTQ